MKSRIYVSTARAGVCDTSHIVDKDVWTAQRSVLERQSSSQGRTTPRRLSVTSAGGSSPFTTTQGPTSGR